MDASTEELMSVSPVKVRCVTGRLERNPACVVYVGNFSGVMLSALYHSRRAVFYAAGEIVQGGSNVQAPAKALAQVLKSSLRPVASPIAAFAGGVRPAIYDAHVLATGKMIAQTFSTAASPQFSSRSRTSGKAFRATEPSRVARRQPPPQSTSELSVGLGDMAPGQYLALEWVRI